MYQESVNQTRWRALRLAMTTALSRWAGSTRSLAFDTINVSYPSPAPFNIPVTVAIHQGFFHEQNLAVQKLIVPGAEVDRAVLIEGDIDYTLRERTVDARRSFFLAVSNFTEDGRGWTMPGSTHWSTTR